MAQFLNKYDRSAAHICNEKLHNLIKIIRKGNINRLRILITYYRSTYGFTTHENEILISRIYIY